MDVETVNSVDTKLRDLLRILRAETSRCSEYGHIHIIELLNVVHHLVGSELQRLALVALTAHDTGNFKIRCRLQSLYREAANVSVTYYGCSYFLHLLYGCYFFVMIVSCMQK